MIKPNLKASWTTYYYVFSNQYWAALIIYTFLMPFLFCSFISFGRKYDESKKKKFHTDFYIWKIGKDLLSGIAMVLLSLSCQDTNHGIPRHFKVTISFRIVFLISCTFGMFNFYIYTSQLVSLLATENYELPINSLTDFLSKTDYQLMIMRDDGLENYFRDGHGYRKELWNKEIQNNPNAYVSSPMEANDILMNKPKRVVFLTPDAASDLKSFPCHLTRASREFAMQSVGYIFQKNSNYTDVFSFAIKKLIEFGKVDYIMNTLVDNQNLKTCPMETESGYKPFGYENIVSIFVLFTMIIVFSFIVAIVECISKYKKK